MKKKEPSFIISNVLVSKKIRRNLKRRFWNEYVSSATVQVEQFNLQEHPYFLNVSNKQGPLPAAAAVWEVSTENSFVDK